MTFENDMLEKLILEGSVEVSGIDLETGRFLYNFTENVQQVNPELFHSVMNTFYTGVMSLWEKGFLDVSLDEKDPTVTLTEKGETLHGSDILSPIEISILETLTKYSKEDG